MAPGGLLAFLSFGIGEMLVLGTVALLVFGGELPQVMRNVGRAYARLRRSLNQVSQPLRDEFRRIDREASITTRRPARPERYESPPGAVPPEDGGPLGSEVPAGEEPAPAGQEALRPPPGTVDPNRGDAPDDEPAPYQPWPGVPAGPAVPKTRGEGAGEGEDRARETKPDEEGRDEDEEDRPPSGDA